MPASPTGTVPRAWLTILRLAFAARPALALRGFASLAQRRRVRGWNALCLAAAEHPRYYDKWIAAVEPSLFSIAPNKSAARPKIGAVLIEGNSEVTRDSLKACFGPDIVIYEPAADLPFESRPVWLLPIRAGDRVAPALAAVLRALIPEADCNLLYWDEDRLDAGRRVSPWLKPDWDPVLFSTLDGLLGSCILRADAISGTVGNWSKLAFDIANSEPTARHIPLVLTHRSEVKVPSAPPAVVAPRLSVSVIVPTRDRADLLAKCLEGLARTRFPGDHEIIVVDNDSQEALTKTLLESVAASDHGRVLQRPGLFNFAALINAGVDAARGDLVCLLNNDIEVLTPDWLEQMAIFAASSEIGAVGAKLLYPDGTLQHAGVAIGIGGAAGHIEKGVRPVPGEFAPWHGETRTVSALTAACLLVERAKFLAVGGMDAERFAIDFNDVDLCLRLAAKGWRNVYCAHATLIHAESQSRGAARHGADLARFEGELEALRSLWKTQDAVDPHYNPLFRRQSERCLLAF